MAAFAAPLPLPLDGLFVADSPVAWASRDSSKPGRADGERWVLQATPAWSSAHVDASADEVSAALLEAFADAAAVALPEALHRDAHRWLYAKTRRSLGVPYLYDEARGIAACGDYCLGGRIEAAWLSGRALGDRLAARR
jgi:predicted NAD/FAD-dependent oxidoreductase